MSCILEQHICDPYVTSSWILPHPSSLSWRSQRTNHRSSHKLMGLSICWFLKTFQLYYLDSVLSARWCVWPTVYTCLNGVDLSQHSEAALTPRVICMFECVCVCGEWDHYSLSRKKMHCALPRLGPDSAWLNSNQRRTKEDLPWWAAS